MLVLKTDRCCSVFFGGRVNEMDTSSKGMGMARHIAVSLATALMLLLSVTAWGAEQALPFTAEEDCDGARYVWYYYKQADLPYDYVPASAFPQSSRFRPVVDDAPQPGDVAWWGEYMAVYDPSAPAQHNAPEEYNLRTAIGLFSLQELEKRFGRATWYRYEKQD